MKRLFLAGGALFLMIFLTGCIKKDSLNYSKASIIQTSEAGDRLAEKDSISLSDNTYPVAEVIQIYPHQKFQEVEGFGGSFTGSSAFVLNQLSKEKRSEVIKAYFSKEGADYSLMRAQIGGSDFSVCSYSYDDTPGDKELKDFSVIEDKNYLIPLIKDAQEISKDGFKIIASPWTAPKWMKDNNAWYGGSLKPEYYQTWALYISKYIKAYQGEGISIWAITPENEPLGNDAHWDSMIFTPKQMLELIKNNLGPQLEKEKSNTKIFIYDQNLDEVKSWVDEILNDPAASKYVFGAAVHWYASTISWFPETLNEIHNKYPNKQILHTEACIDNDVPAWKNDRWYWSKLATDWGYEWASEKDKPLHPMYKPVFRYATDIIGCLNSWVSGWIDWNIVLNDKGGPNHANNWAVAPVIVKPGTGEVYYTPLYYIMCHFSKYIRPGAYRIGIKTEIKNLMVTACLNPDKSIAVEILNTSDNAVKYNIKLEDKNIVNNIPGNALQTVLIR